MWTPVLRPSGRGTDPRTSPSAPTDLSRMGLSTNPSSDPTTGRRVPLALHRLDAPRVSEGGARARPALLAYPEPSVGREVRDRWVSKKPSLSLIDYFKDPIIKIFASQKFLLKKGSFYWKNTKLRQTVVVSRKRKEKKKMLFTFVKKFFFRVQGTCPFFSRGEQEGGRRTRRGCPRG